MVIDVNLLKRQGKDSENFEFIFSVDSEICLSPDIKFTQGKFTGELVLDGKVFVTGTLEVLAEGDCSRCLEPAKELVVIDVDEVFSERPVDEEYRYKSGLVDFSEMIKDKLLSNQPTVIFCKEGCKGLCPKCGCNLNESDCSCEK